MKSLVTACLALFCAGLAAAQPAPAAAVAASAGEPAVKRTVVEDDGVRVEELRVRGQTQSIVVRSKAGGGAKPYEIVTVDGARDLSKDRGAAGHSVWRLFGF
jgi:hypothetical protein